MCHNSEGCLTLRYGWELTISYYNHNYKYGNGNDAGDIPFVIH